MKAKAKMKKSQQNENYDWEQPVVKNTIKEKVLDKWLDDVNINDIKNITRIESVHLWSIGSCERYRINVWVEEKFANCVYLRNRIAKSWFVHYDKSKDKITDKTIEKEIE